MAGAGQELVKRFDNLSPADRSKLLCKWLAQGDDRAIEFIRDHMALDGFDKEYLLDTAGGIMRPTFAARLLAVIGLPSDLPKMLNLDIASIPLENYLTAGQLSELSASGLPGASDRLVIATAMTDPAAVEASLKSWEEGLPKEEAAARMHDFVNNWVISNPDSLIQAVSHSPSVMARLGDLMGKDVCLNSPENLPLRRQLDQVCLGRISAESSGGPEKQGIADYLVASHSAPDELYTQQLAQLPAREWAEATLGRSVTHWAAGDPVSTATWLSSQASQPAYLTWVKAFVKGCKDPEAVRAWSSLLPTSEQADPPR